MEYNRTINIILMIIFFVCHGTIALAVPLILGSIEEAGPQDTAIFLFRIYSFFVWVVLPISMWYYSTDLVRNTW